MPRRMRALSFDSKKINSSYLFTFIGLRCTRYDEFHAFANILDILYGYVTYDIKPFATVNPLCPYWQVSGILRKFLQRVTCHFYVLTDCKVTHSTLQLGCQNVQLSCKDETGTYFSISPQFRKLFSKQRKDSRWTTCPQQGGNCAKTLKTQNKEK